MADIKGTLEQQEQVLIENREFVIKQLDADDVIDELIQECRAKDWIGDNE